MKFAAKDGRASVRFEKDVPLSFANAIRRTLLLDLSAVAPSVFKIQKNTSTFPCETLAHRIGLCPVRANSSERQAFALKAVGPGNFYSDAVRKIGGESGDDSGDDGLLAPGIYLFTLAAGQEVRLCGECRSGTGREHARFQTTCGVALSTDSEGASTIEFETLVHDSESAQAALLEVTARALATLRRRLRTLLASLSRLADARPTDEDADRLSPASGAAPALDRGRVAAHPSPPVLASSR